MVREVTSDDRASAQFPEFFGVPSIAAEKRDLDSNFPRLPCDDPYVRVVARYVNRVRLLSFDGRELSAEIAVPLRVGLDADDLPSHLRELVGEDFGESQRIGALDLFEYGCAAELQVFLGKFGHHEALKRVDEAHSEDVVPDGRHLGVG